MIVLYECIDSLPQSVIMYLFITGTYRPTAAVKGTEWVTGTYRGCTWTRGSITHC